MGLVQLENVFLIYNYYTGINVYRCLSLRVKDFFVFWVVVVLDLVTSSCDGEYSEAKPIYYKKGSVIYTSLFYLPHTLVIFCSLIFNLFNPTAKN